MRDIPTLQSDRHDWGWKHTRSVQVPLWTANPDGELQRGFFRVPAHALDAKPSTNEAHVLSQYIRERTARWVAWKAKQGWFLHGSVNVIAQRPVPVEHAMADGVEDEREIVLQARFKREKPVYQFLDDFLAQKDDADRYGVDLNAEKLPETVLPDEQQHIIPDNDPGDALVAAEERRQQLGLRRKLNIRNGQLVDADVEPNT